MRYRIKLLKNYTNKIFRNPSRMFLTLIGLIISVMILTSGLVFAETYCTSKIKNVEFYKNRQIAEIIGDYEYSMYDEIQNINMNTYLEITNHKSYNIANIKCNNKSYTIGVNVVRTDYNDLNFIATDWNDNKRFVSSLLSGRLISKEDIEEKKNVAVIPDTLEKFMFGEKSAIGEKMFLPVYGVNPETNCMEIEYYTETVVIGVIKDGKDASDYIENPENSDTEGEGVLNFKIYVPLSFSVEKNDENLYMRIVSASNNDYYSLVQKINNIVSDYDQEKYRQNDYWSIMRDMNEELKSVNDMLALLSIFMFLISGLCITNTMFFSVKERINEIGIRKAIGADSTDIILQFVYEGFLYGLISALVGIILSIIVDIIIYLNLLKMNIWNPGVTLIISQRTVVLAATISIFISIMSSVIPAIYASKIKVTDALRYD